MKRNWSDDELAAQWSLSPKELALLPNRVGHNRFGFAVQLKFFQIEGRFPRSPREVPAAALRHLASELGLSINLFGVVSRNRRKFRHSSFSLQAS